MKFPRYGIIIMEIIYYKGGIFTLWGILGVSETKNKIEIKEAYMKKLQKINPEDDGEGFKILRAAYEEALKFADCDDSEEVEDASSIDIWMNKVDSIYRKFSLRIDEEAWKEILEDDVCFAIESRVEAVNKLLRFLMEHSYIPKEIWFMLDEYFSFSTKKEELIEAFPEDFIEFVMDKVNPNYGDSLEYYYFEEINDNKDYDSWIYLFLKIRMELNSGDLEEAGKHLDEVNELDINHPSLNMLNLRYFLKIGENEEARKIGENLFNRYPEEYFAVYAMAVVEWHFENFELAKGYYNKVLKIKPNDYNSKIGLADCYLETGSFKEAEKLFREILDINRNDTFARDKLYAITNKYIEELEEKCEANPDDKKLKITLCWYYFENYKYDDIISLCEKFEPDKEDENQYFDLIIRAYIAKSKYDLALEYINKWEENLKADGDAAEDGELELLYYEKARALSNLGKYEQALVYYDKALELDKDDIFALNGKAAALNKLEKYAQSLEIIERGLALNSSDVMLHINKAEALFELRHYRDAIDECNITIDIYPYYTDPYLIKMKIYSVYDRYDDVLEILDELESLEINNFDTNIYKIKAFTNKKRIKDAQNLAISMLKANSKNENTHKLHKIYYELAIIQYNQRLYEKALGYIIKAIKSSVYEEEYLGFRATIYRALRKFDLAINDYDTIISKKIVQDWYVLLKKAEVYEETRKLDKASVLYEEILILNPENGYVTNFSLGKIYEEMNNYDKALEYFNKQLEIEESAYYYIYRGMFYARNNKILEAIEDYKNAIKLEPENPYPYNNLACIYEEREEYEEAIGYFKKAIELDKEGNSSQFYNNIIDCYIRLNNNEMALKYFDRANKAVKSNKKLYLEKAKLLTKMKLYDEAIENYKEALKVKSADLDEIYSKMAATFEKIGEYDKAIECYNKKLENAPKYTDAYRQIGYQYYKLGDYENAIKYYELQSKSSFGWNPASKATNLLLIADCYEKLNAKEEAVKNYNEALSKFLKTNWKTPYEYTSIGKCYLGLNKSSEAIENFERAINMDLCEGCEYCGCYDGYFGIGEVYEKEKKYAQAREYYKKSLEMNENDKYTKDAIERVEKLAK